MDRFVLVTVLFPHYGIISPSLPVYNSVVSSPLSFSLYDPSSTAPGRTCPPLPLYLTPPPVPRQASGRGDKFTFEVKWLIPLAEIVSNCDDLPPDPRGESAGSSSLVTLKSQASTVRDQIRAQERYYGLQGVSAGARGGYGL